MHQLPKTFFVAILIVTVSTVHAQTGKSLFEGFTANPADHSHLPDNSYAGYRLGQAPIPEVANVVDITDFGGSGDGSTDNREAFEKAIEAAYAAGGGAVYLPDGTYKVDGIIWLNRPGVVIRGQSREGTKIKFSNPADDYVSGLNKPISTNLWSWTGGIVWVGARGSSFRKGDDVGYYVAATGAKQGYKSSTNPWEYWRKGEICAAVSDNNPRGDTVLTVDDAAKLKSGMFVLMTWDNESTYSLLKEIGQSDPFQSWSNWGTWFTPESYPQWMWPVEIRAVEGNQVTLAEPLRVSTKSTYNVRFWKTDQVITEAGIENVTLQLGATATSDYDLGWNGLFFNRAYNCWAKNVKVNNASNGFHVSAAKNISLVQTYVTGDSYYHHPYTNRCMSSNVLYEDFTIDVTEDSRGGTHGINSEFLTSGNVWSKGTMNRGTFDTHRGMPFDMVRTEIVLRNEKNSNPGGSKKAGAYAGRRMVHWNVTVQDCNRDDPGLYVYQKDNHTYGALVGIQGAAHSDIPCWNNDDCGVMPCGDKNVVIADHNTTPNPVNLYDAMVSERKERQSWIELTFPRTSLVPPGSITLTAHANALDGRSVSSVTYYANGSSIGSASSGPTYALDWDMPDGVHDIRAKMTDSEGASLWSATQRVTAAKLVRVENDDPEVTIQASTKEHREDSGCSGGSFLYFRDGEGHISYTFTGIRVKVYLRVKKSDESSIDVYIDDKLVQSEWVDRLNTYDYLFFDSGLLSNDSHTIKLQQSQSRIYLDYFEVYSTDPTTSASAGFADGKSAVPNMVRAMRTGPAHVFLDLNQAGDARVDLLDIRGRSVRTLHTGTLSAGTHVFPISAARHSQTAGVFLVRLIAGNNLIIRKITCVR